MRALVLAAVCAAFLLASPALAQQVVCGERGAFIEKLERAYAEFPVAMGLTAKGALIEVFASAAGSWTFLITPPSGPSCVAATGVGWETLPTINTGTAS